MKKIIAVLLLIVLTFGITACGAKSGDAEELAKVGETVITSGELEQYMQLYAYIQGMDLTKITEEGSLQYMKTLVLEDMISMEAIKQSYSGKEDKVLPKTVDEDMKKFIKESKATDGVSQFLEEKKISDETLGKFYLNQFYTNAYFDQVAKGMKTLDADTKAYYEKNKETYAVDEVTASHILVADEALANDILAKLKAGESFEALAKQYGTDGTKDSGGSLGTFGRGKMVAEFEQAAFALKPGEISGVVKTKFGYHIIKVTDKNQAQKTYDEVKESIKATLVSPVAEKKIKELKETIGVEYLSKDYKPAE